MNASVVIPPECFDSVSISVFDNVLGPLSNVTVTGSVSVSGTAPAQLWLSSFVGATAGGFQALNCFSNLTFKNGSQVIATGGNNTVVTNFNQQNIGLIGASLATQQVQKTGTWNLTLDGNLSSFQSTLPAGITQSSIYRNYMHSFGIYLQNLMDTNGGKILYLMQNGSLTNFKE